MAIKILLNSLYGALANKHFLYFSPGLAEGVTLTGQDAIKWAEKTMNAELNKLLKQKMIMLSLSIQILYMLTLVLS